MFRPFTIKIVILLFLSFLFGGRVFPQPGVGFSITTLPEQCEKGAAQLEISGTLAGDSIFTHWSTGEQNIMQITGVGRGEHNVNVRIKRKTNNTTLVKDTLLSFVIEKAECAVSVSRFFSPNDDQHNDVLVIGNISYYPNFEFEIFNKWGQRVHKQTQQYTPWDGKWLGADLPDGTYYFIFFFDAGDRKKLLKGDITILR